MRLELRAQPPVPIHIGEAHALPVDWYRWRDALLGGAPLEPIVEGFTEPEGWSVTIAFVATADGIRAHAFYAVFDRAVHAWADVDASARDGVRAAFASAVPVWPDEIVALGDL